MYLNVFRILVGRCGGAVVRERDWDAKGLGARSGFDPGLRSSSFL